MNESQIQELNNLKIISYRGLFKTKCELKTALYFNNSSISILNTTIINIENEIKYLKNKRISKIQQLKNKVVKFFTFGFYDCNKKLLNKIKNKKTILSNQCKKVVNLWRKISEIEMELEKVTVKITKINTIRELEFDLYYKNDIVQKVINNILNIENEIEYLKNKQISKIQQLKNKVVKLFTFGCYDCNKKLLNKIKNKKTILSNQCKKVVNLWKEISEIEIELGKVIAKKQAKLPTAEVHYRSNENEEYFDALEELAPVVITYQTKELRQLI